MRRIRGRRVILLLASALPLLARDDDSSTMTNQQQQQQPPHPDRDLLLHIRNKNILDLDPISVVTKQKQHQKDDFFNDDDDDIISPQSGSSGNKKTTDWLKTNDINRPVDDSDIPLTADDEEGGIPDDDDNDDIDMVGDTDNKRNDDDNTAATEGGVSTKLQNAPIDTSEQQEHEEKEENGIDPPSMLPTTGPPGATTTKLSGMDSSTMPKPSSSPPLSEADNDDNDSNKDVVNDEPKQQRNQQQGEEAESSINEEQPSPQSLDDDSTTDQNEDNIIRKLDGVEDEELSDDPPKNNPTDRNDLDKINSPVDDNEDDEEKDVQKDVSSDQNDESGQIKNNQKFHDSLREEQIHAYDEYPIDDTDVELLLEDAGKEDGMEPTTKGRDKKEDTEDQQQYAYDVDPVDDTATELLLEELEDAKVLKEDKSPGDFPAVDEDDPSKIEEIRTENDDERVETAVDSDTHGDNTAANATDEKETGASEDETLIQNATSIEDEVEIPSDDSHAEIGDENEDDEAIDTRFSVDYASKSAGALIIEKSKDFKGTSNLLMGDKDKYAITPCQEKKKFVVMSLSEDILVKEIKLANYERFSSTMKNFQVMGSQTLGAGTWIDLGNYTASPGNGEQVFTVESPAWARYLKFKFRSHHGMEYYCTLSQIQVHGSTMVQGFHEQWEMIEDENDEDSHGAVEQEAFETGNESNNTTVDLSTSNTISVDVNIAGGSKNEVGPQNLTETHSVDSGNAAPSQGKAHPTTRKSAETNIETINVLDAFASSSALFEVLQGRCVNEDLFPDLYRLMPTSLESFPHSMVRSAASDRATPYTKNDETILNASNQNALPSLKSHELRVLGDTHSTMVTSGDSETITSPKMNEFSSSLVKKNAPTNSFKFNFTWNVRSRLARLWNSTIGAEKSHGGDLATDDKNQEVHQAVQTERSDESNDKDSQTQPAIETNSEEDNDSVSTQVGSHGDEVAEASGDSGLDRTLLQLLQDLPSAECLSDLDFSAFKAKMSTSRKSSSFSGPSHGNSMEPIFKKLTNEIFALQTSLSVHDQFTKVAVACYQRVLLDLMLEMARMKSDNSNRITRLEEKMMESIVQRAWNFVTDLFVAASKWIVSKLSLLFGFVVDQYPSVEKMVVETLVRLIEWTEKVAKPRSQQFLGFIITSGAKLMERQISHVFGSDRSTTLIGSGNNEHAKTIMGATFGSNSVLLAGETAIDTGLISDHDFQEDGAWVYPMVPIFLVLLICRLLMCFASSSSTTRKGNWPSPIRHIRERSMGREANAPPSSIPTNARTDHAHTQPGTFNSPPAVSSIPHSGNNEILSARRSNEYLKGSKSVLAQVAEEFDVPNLEDEITTPSMVLKAETIMVGQIKPEQVDQKQQPQHHQSPGSESTSTRSSQRNSSNDASPSVVSMDNSSHQK
jgi:Sad1 / UNC-like C-terminal